MRGRECSCECRDHRQSDRPRSDRDCVGGRCRTSRAPARQRDAERGALSGRRGDLELPLQELHALADAGEPESLRLDRRDRSPWPSSCTVRWTCEPSSQRSTFTLRRRTVLASIGQRLLGDAVHRGLDLLGQPAGRSLLPRGQVDAEMHLRGRAAWCGRPGSRAPPRDRGRRVPPGATRRSASEDSVSRPAAVRAASPMNAAIASGSRVRRCPAIAICSAARF